jgi:hypothetical protein
VLDFATFDVEEVASENAAPHREGRSLVCLLPLYTIAELVELKDSEIYDADQQGRIFKHKVTFLSGDNGPCGWEMEYEDVLRRITGYNFLPVLQHLTNVENRSAFVTCDCDIETYILARANIELLDDRHRFESSSVGHKVSNVMLSGENFLLSSNNTDLGLSVQQPTAESLLSIIDDLVDNEVSVEGIVKPIAAPLQPSYIVDAPRLGAIYDFSSSQLVGFAALDELLGHSDMASNVFCRYFVVGDHVSDIAS